MSGEFATERDEKLFNQGYEKGVRDMFLELRETCNRHTTWDKEHKCKCNFRDNNNIDLYPCNIETCPITQKLLKGVK